MESNLLIFFYRLGDTVRCVGHLIGQTGQFRIQNISKINITEQMALIKRLEAIGGFELAKASVKVT